MPDVIGRSDADASRALANFKIEQIKTANAAPAGEVLAQEPPPGSLALAESTVTLHVSDGSLAVAASTDRATAPATAAAASPASEPATSAATASTPVPSAPQEPIDSPAARGQFPPAFLAIAALIFGAGVSLGLLSGALLMRRRLVHGRPVAGESAPAPTPPEPQQPVGQPPAESDARGVAETSASPEIQFAAQLVPVATTIMVEPRADSDGISISVGHSSDHAEQVWLKAAIGVSGGDVERAFIEQGKDEPAVARAFEGLRGSAAERAADELNRALDVDVFDVLAQGWVQMPAMHRAVQLSALTHGPSRGPSKLLTVERHTITSNSHVALDTRLGQSSLPRLELALEIVADIQSATLAARDGRIDLVAIGEATVLTRLKYKGVLVKEHATEIASTPRDPPKTRPHAAGRPASVDFPL